MFQLMFLYMFQHNHSHEAMRQFRQGDLPGSLFPGDGATFEKDM